MPGVGDVAVPASVRAALGVNRCFDNAETLRFEVDIAEDQDRRRAKKASGQLGALLVMAAAAAYVAYGWPR